MYCSKAFLNTPVKKMSISVLVDRNHNTYPIKANYVGLSLSTTLKEYIRVDLASNDKEFIFLNISSFFKSLQLTVIVLL